MAATAVITLSIKTLMDQGVTSDNQLLTTLDPEAVICFKTLHRRSSNTEKIDLVLTPMPISTTVNSAGFSTWADTITEDLAQNLSQDKFTTMEYIIRPDKEKFAYGDLDPSLNSLTRRGDLLTGPEEVLRRTTNCVLWLWIVMD